MDAITFIQQNLDVEKLLQHYGFEKIKHNGVNIRACCKIHGGNNPTAFVINKETGLWYCHTNCGGGDIFTLVQRMENIDFPSSVRFLANFFKLNINNLNIMQKKSRYIKDLQNFINIIKAKRTQNFSAFTIEEEIKEVIKYRNFKKETLKHFNVGYVEKIKLHSHNNKPYTLYNRLVFPIIFNQTQIGISLRRTKTKDYPKWSHQPAHINIKHILYNYDNIKYDSPVVICEGINDVLAFHEINVQAVAIFGSHITKEQYRLLLKTSSDLVFAFDGDKAGQQALKHAVTLFKNKANISFICFDESEDPESIAREELKSKYVKRLQCT